MAKIKNLLRSKSSKIRLKKFSKKLFKISLLYSLITLLIILMSRGKDNPVAGLIAAYIFLGSLLYIIFYPAMIISLKLISFSFSVAVKLKRHALKEFKKDPLILIKFIFRLLKKPVSLAFKSAKHILKSARKEPLIIINLVISAAILSYLINIQTRVSRIERRFGGEEKLACSEEKVKELMQESVVRVIGSFAEGSGFPISDTSIITSYHVIEGEPSPKVVFADGTIETPHKILGDKNMDFAVLTLEKELEPLNYFGWFGGADIETNPTIGEHVYAFGYPLGSTIQGPPAVIRGSFSGKRFLNEFDINVVESDISLVKGMSGGPLVDSCGQVIGINTLGIGGLSMFLDIQDVQRGYYDLTDEDVAKIEIETSTPKGVVEAFYTFIKARDLRSAFDLLSSERKAEIDSFEEWIKGYANTLQVELVASKVDEEDENKVLVKLTSKDWVDGQMVIKYFEGYWQVTEDMKLGESNIAEIQEPGWLWFHRF